MRRAAGSCASSAAERRGIERWRRTRSHRKKRARHEDAVGIGPVVGEGRALRKAVAPIERASGRKIVGRARLKAEARHAACLGGCHDVAQHHAPRPPAAHGCEFKIEG